MVENMHENSQDSHSYNLYLSSKYSSLIFLVLWSTQITVNEYIKRVVVAKHLPMTQKKYVLGGAAQQCTRFTLLLISFSKIKQTPNNIVRGSFGLRSKYITP